MVQFVVVFLFGVDALDNRCTKNWTPAANLQDMHNRFMENWRL